MNLGADVYQILGFLQELKSKHIPLEDANALLLGMFGYIDDVSSTQIRNSITMSSEWMNEIFPIRSRIKKNIITHATMANITNFTAIPAMMDFMIGIREDDILSCLIDDKFIIDRDTKIEIGTFDFHPEYDVIIQRQKITNNKNIYIGHYDTIDKDFRLGTIKNPYLKPAVRIRNNNQDFIYFKIRCRQMEFSSFYKKVISVDNIENKSFEFEFENQLAEFNVSVKRNKTGQNIKMKSVYDNTPIIDPKDKYCFYSFIGTNAVKVTFTKDSYIPTINDEINVEIITTKGSRGNFTFKEELIIEPSSDKFNYKGILMTARPISESMKGENTKTIEELRKIIPRELLSRGSITTDKDLDNFFNVLNDHFNRLYFDKKIHNQFTRVHYGFLLLKDLKNNIIPSNTIDIQLDEKDFDINENGRLVLKPGIALELNKTTGLCDRISSDGFTSDKIDDMEYNGFMYSTPFTTVVNKSPLMTSTYLTIFNRKYDLDFKYINDNSLLQFIAVDCKWRRELLSQRDTYKLDIEITQNIDDELKLVETDESGFITSSKIKVVAVFKDKNGSPFRWANATPIIYNKNSKSYIFRFNIVTDDNIDRDGNIHITNLIDLRVNNSLHGYFKGSGTGVDIHILTDQGLTNNEKSIDSIIPGLDIYTLCNTYSVEGGVDFFINFSNIISSTVIVDRNDTTSPWFYRIKSIPAVRYSYLLANDRITHLINYIMQKKVFLDTAITLLENQFGIDLKFFNTYGPSKINYIGQKETILNKVNLELKFRFKFITQSNNEAFVETIKKEIKNYIENLDRDYNIHISNLVSHLKEKYTFISYIEFIGINDYDSDYQSIIRNIEKKKVFVPEFINIGSKTAEYVPDINIEVIV